MQQKGREVRGAEQRGGTGMCEENCEEEGREGEEKSHGGGEKA